MSAGLFGKLPAKRDFIGMNASRRFLEAWEPWLQAGVAMSKQMLGDAWVETYNRAPIWRFWLGADFCGETMIGAFMPSVDGVGRSFPLAVFVGEGDASLAPPELEPNDAWFEAAEAVLLDALEPGATLERIAERVGALPAPALEPRINKDAGFEELAEGGVLARDIGRRSFRRLSRRAPLRTKASLCVPDLLVDDRRRGLSFAGLTRGRLSACDPLHRHADRGLLG